jgi:hypothetical protein
LPSPPGTQAPGTQAGIQAPRHPGTTLTLTLTHNDMTTTCVTARSVVTGKTSSLHFASPAAAWPHGPLPPCLALLCLALPCRGAVAAALSRLHHPQLRTRPEPTWTSSLTAAASAPIQARRARLASACIRCCSIALLSASLFLPSSAPTRPPSHPASANANGNVMVIDPAQTWSAVMACPLPARCCVVRRSPHALARPCKHKHTGTRTHTPTHHPQTHAHAHALPHSTHRHTPHASPHCSPSHQASQHGRLHRCPPPADTRASHKLPQPLLPTYFISTSPVT